MRVHPSGKAVFIVQWRDRGRGAKRAGHATRRITLGPTDNMTEAEARQFFQERPVGDGKADDVTPVSFAALTEEFLTRYRRVRKERYLNHEELERLGAALDRYDQIMPVPTRLVRALLLTGCRRGEMVNLRWRDVQEERLSLPDSKTGPKFVHIAPQAQDILQTMPRLCAFVFPNRTLDGPISGGDLQNLWSLVRNSADLRNVRLHDLRHTYAGIAMCHSTHIVTLSRLLGHADTETALRYAHFADAELCWAVRTVSSRIADDLDLNAGEEL